jgi:Delta7-sterol 5-desaturase
MNDVLSSMMAYAQTLPLPLVGKVYLFNLFNEAKHYLLAALFMWGLLHVLLKSRLAHRLIDQWPSRTDIHRELAYSFLSMLVFAGLSLAVVAGVFNGHFVIYRDPGQHGWWWLVASFPLLLVWQDVYFYTTHRLLHTRWLFKHVHGVHHRSRQPSPWAAYAFHPIEALINGLVTPLALCVVPLHGGVLFASVLHQIIRNTHGHAAVETMPAGFTRHVLGQFFTTTTHHHLHHETARGNYGLWFTWWDRWLGTERMDYHGRFDLATQAQPQ